MSRYGSGVRPFYLRDLLLLQRLQGRGVSLDSESYLVRGLHPARDALLARLSLSGLGTPTLIVCTGRVCLAAQFRHVPGDTHAHLTFVAPAPPDGRADTGLESGWLYALDALAQEAARRGAHTLHAEVDENSAIFEWLRRAGYAAYARQDLWRRAPAPPPPVHGCAPLRWATPHDSFGIRALVDRAVPRLVQQADPALPLDGLVYLCDAEVRGYLYVGEGSRGVYLRPYLLPDAYDEARAVLDSALALLPRAVRVPVYCCVRRDQDWLRGPLAEQGFVPWARQTVMVKHMTARVQHPAFAPLAALNGLIVSGPGGKP